MGNIRLIGGLNIISGLHNFGINLVTHYRVGFACYDIYIALPTDLSLRSKKLAVNLCLSDLSKAC